MIFYWFFADNDRWDTHGEFLVVPVVPRVNEPQAVDGIVVPGLGQQEFRALRQPHQQARERDARHATDDGEQVPRLEQKEPVLEPERLRDDQPRDACGKNKCRLAMVIWSGPEPRSRHRNREETSDFVFSEKEFTIRNLFFFIMVVSRTKKKDFKMFKLTSRRVRS